MRADKLAASEQFPRKDWQYEVANGDTVLGYAEWLDHQIEASAHMPSWADCCRASGRLADLVCRMYHPKDPKARVTWPTSTWAEIIASELGIEVPESD